MITAVFIFSGVAACSKTVYEDNQAAFSTTKVNMHLSVFRNWTVLLVCPTASIRDTTPSERSISVDRTKNLAKKTQDQMLMENKFSKMP